MDEAEVTNHTTPDTHVNTTTTSIGHFCFSIGEHYATYVNK